MNYQFDSHIVFRLHTYNIVNNNNDVYKNIANNFYKNLKQNNLTKNTMKNNSIPYLESIPDTKNTIKKRVSWNENKFIAETYSKQDYDRKIDGDQIMHNRMVFTYLKNNYNKIELNTFMDLY